MNKVEENKNKIIQVLDAFKIGYDNIRITCCPQVTFYGFYPEIGVKLSKIKKLKDEFAMAIASGDVNIVAPTDNGMVCIEVPNTNRQNIPVLDLLYSDEYMNTTMELPLCIGRKVDNSIFMVDLATIPHLLVAGATGMGKSVGLNVIITSLLRKKTPEELKLVLIDPKQVELSVYDAIEKPYLAHLEGYSPICIDPKDAKDTLEAVIRLMEERYATLKSFNVRNIQEFNSLMESEHMDYDKLPYYVVVIDEYGDLILQGSKEMEVAICFIAQKARAVGIHMIISTQRPDTKIVTGSIKANFPTRIAFRTTTGTDSRVILDRMGAERLTGKGDMLYFAGVDMERVQCAYTSTEEVMQMCSEIRDDFDDCEATRLPEAPQPVESDAKSYRNWTVRDWLCCS